MAPVSRALSPVYKPRHPEGSLFYRLIEEHFERYVRQHEGRYEPRDGPLRAAISKAVEGYLACGRLEGGFARIRCANCRAEHLLAFSCQTRNFCPSCQAKRSVLFAEHLVTEILEPVPHRHVVLTIPRVLRGMLQRERRLLGLVARSGRDAIVASFCAILDRRDVQPGLVISIQTFGSYAANFHPHLHVLAADGAFLSDGEFVPLPYFDARLVEEVFRRRLLQRLHKAERLSEEFHRSLLGWVHSGFSVHGEQRVPAEDPEGVERLARYITRAPIALDRLEAAEAGCVRVATPPDPRTGATGLRLDALDWIHAITSQIPDRGQHLVRYCGWYSSRSRGIRGRRRDETVPGPAAESPGGAPPPGGPPQDPGPCAPPAVTCAPPEVTPTGTGSGPPHESTRRPSRASWARLLRRIMEVDPLLCARCGSEMKVVSVIDDRAVIDAILRHVQRTGGQDPFEGPFQGRAPPEA